MKRSFSMLIILLSSVQLFAQNRQNTAAYRAPVPKNPVVKQDTTVYAAETFDRANDRLDGLLLQIKDFSIGANGAITQNGQPIKNIKINGEMYKGLDAAHALTILPYNMIHNIEVIDTRYQDGNTEKSLNVVAKTNRKDQLADILVGEGYVRSIFLLPMSRKRQDEFQESLYATVPTPPGFYVNQYGDQIPHFLVKPAPGTFDNSAPAMKARSRKRMGNQTPPPVVPVNN